MTAARDELRPFAGPNYQRCRALDVGGKKRLMLLCLIAAWTDAGRSGNRADDLAQRLGWEYVTTLALLKRVRRDGHITKTNQGGRWRLADHLAQPAPRRPKHRRRHTETNVRHSVNGSHERENAQTQGSPGSQASEQGTALSWRAA